MRHAGIALAHPRRPHIAEEHNGVAAEIRLPEIGKFGITSLDDNSIWTPELERRRHRFEVAAVFRHAHLPSGLPHIAVHPCEALSPKPPGILEKKHVSVFLHLILPMTRSIREKREETNPDSCT